MNKTKSARFERIERAKRRQAENAFPKIRIEGDATHLNTKVLVDGKPLLCQFVSIAVDAEKPSSVKATIVVFVDELDLKHEVERG